MKSPFFSIVIPTKNRSDLVGHAIQSVLEQSYPDFEIIVADNDDSESTADVVGSFHDSRIRHCRTGNLSMPDNWEFGLEQARGEYFALLEDKQAYKKWTLETVYDAISQNGYELLRWQSDSFDDTGRFPRVWNPSCSHTDHFMTAEEILGVFTNHSYGAAKTIFPIGHLSCVSAKVVKKIRRGAVGRLCPPVSPDYTLAIQALNFTEGVYQLSEALVIYTTLRKSNGQNFKFKKKGADQFLKELGGDDTIFYSHIPVKARTIPGTLFNDYAILRGRLGGRLEKFPVNWENFFMQSFNSIMETHRAGVDIKPEQDAWEKGLSEQPNRLQEKVYSSLGSYRPFHRHCQGSAARTLGKCLGMRQLELAAKHLIRGKIKRDPRWRFDNFRDYMRWEEALRAG